MYVPTIADQEFLKRVTVYLLDSVGFYWILLLLLMPISQASHHHRFQFSRHSQSMSRILRFATTRDCFIALLIDVHLQFIDHARPSGSRDCNRLDSGLFFLRLHHFVRRPAHLVSSPADGPPLPIPCNDGSSPRDSSFNLSSVLDVILCIQATHNPGAPPTSFVTDARTSLTESCAESLP